MRFRQFLVLWCWSLRALAQDAPAGDPLCVKSYEVDLEGLSLEGGKGMACVGANDRVRRAGATLYGETGKSTYYFTFRNDSAFVAITTYRYLRPLAEVRAAKDMTREPIRNLRGTELAFRSRQLDSAAFDVYRVLERELRLQHPGLK